MRHRSISRRGRPALLMTAALALFVAWGCDGRNLFQPVEVGPRVVELLAPDAVSEGTELPVSVRAVGVAAVDSIVLVIKGGNFQFREMERGDPGRVDLTAEFSFDIPRPVTDTLAVLTAFAVDIEGNVSMAETDTVTIRDTTPPSVGITPEEASLAQGGSLTFTVQASDNIGVERVGVRVTGPDGELVFADSANVSGTSVSRSFTWQSEPGVSPGEHTVEAFAMDRAGNRTSGGPTGVASVEVVDGFPPVVTILQPTGTANIRIGDSIFVRTQLSDNEGIDSVEIRGVAFRGDPELGTFEEVPRFLTRMVVFDPMPADTVLNRFLPPIMADSTIEAGRIIVTAWDREGNVAADTAMIQLRGDDVPPSVAILQPGAGSTLVIGDSVLVRVRVSDLQGFVRSGVAEIRFQGVAFRGDPELGTDEVVDRFVPRTVTIDPPEPAQQELGRYLQPTGDSTIEEVHLIVTVTDAWGNVNADTMVVNMIPPFAGVEADAGLSGAGPPPDVRAPPAASRAAPAEMPPARPEARR